jgi:polyphosphate kinase 2
MTKNIKPKKSTLSKISNVVKTQTTNKALEKKLTSLMLKYKTEIISKLEKLEKKDINRMFKEIKDEVEPNIIVDFNLDSFFRGLSNIISMKKNTKNNIEKFFKSYINNLPERIGLLNEVKDFSDDEEFEELKKLKSTRILKIPKKKFKSEKIPLQIELLKLQEWMKKTGFKLALVFDGRDSSGKGSAIKTITEFLQPKYFKVQFFDVPTKDEEKKWFSRYEKVLPKEGHITFYDRSWYNRAVNDPVMGYCTDEEYKKFMTDVIPFEEKLNKQGIKLIKFWFSITKETQKFRFKLRQMSPLKYWKFSENDLKSMKKWDDFTLYKEKMFNETSTSTNPWIVVDSDDKRLAQLNVLKYILTTIDYDGRDLEVIGHPLPEIITVLI